MSYYQKYRPKNFSALVGQAHIKTILEQAIVAAAVSHAYLFCGNKGTGKTSTARILAKAINCLSRDSKSAEPCNSCRLCQAINASSCLDVIEIDAASNRGIDDIRVLREQVKFPPQEARKKIVIIDEAHMLTKEAFNALLKTLEEPPDYLTFILITTEFHKLPATIISRCQRFDFRLPTQADLIYYLNNISQAEELSVDKEALQKLAKLANNSFRDGAMLLEQVASPGKTVGVAAVTKLLGLAPVELIGRYLGQLGGQTDPSLKEDLINYFDQAGNPSVFLDECFRLLEEELLASSISNPDQLLAKLVLLRYQLKYSPSGQLPILAALTENREHPKGVPLGEKIENRKEDADITDPLEKVSDQEQETMPVDVAVQVPPAELPETELTKSWQAVLTKLLADNQSSLVAILKTAKPVKMVNSTLTIAVQFGFHAEHLRKDRNRKVIESALSDSFGQTVQITTEIEAQADDLSQVAEELFA